MTVSNTHTYSFSVTVH